MLDEPVTERVRRLIAKYENRIERLEKANGRLCEQINSMPEIVRCRDCFWAKPDQSDHDYRGEYRCNMWIADVSADGYCWRGRRKEDGDD